MRTTRHPNYQFVVIKDAATDFAILTRSTQTSDQTVEWTDGKTYPLITVETSSASHPFFTGTQRLLDSTGQIEKFKKRYAS